VTGGTADVSATVQELIDDAPASVTTESDQISLLSGPFPAAAIGELVSVDLDGARVSEGYGLARLEDPTRLQQANPEEFRLEAGCYSNADNVAYIVETEATETRNLIFSPDSDPELVFDDNGALTVESTVYLSGAVLVWSTVSDADLTGLEGEIVVNVTQDDADTVFEGSISLVTDGPSAPSFATTGPLRVTALTLEDITAQGELDDATIAELARIEETGSLLILALESQSHTYTYDVVADTPLTLTATMRVHLRVPPGGVGVAATLGGPFEDLAALVTEGLSGTDGEGVARAINTAAGLAEPVATPANPPLCGILGIESMILLIAPLVCAGRRIGRRQ